MPCRGTSPGPQNLVSQQCLLCVLHAPCCCVGNFFFLFSHLQRLYFPVVGILIPSLGGEYSFNKGHINLLINETWHCWIQCEWSRNTIFRECILGFHRACYHCQDQGPAKCPSGKMQCWQSVHWTSKGGNPQPGTEAYVARKGRSSDMQRVGLGISKLSNKCWCCTGWLHDYAGGVGREEKEMVLASSFVPRKPFREFMPLWKEPWDDKSLSHLPQMLPRLLLLHCICMGCLLSALLKGEDLASKCHPHSQEQRLVTQNSRF